MKNPKVLKIICMHMYMYACVFISVCTSVYGPLHVGMCICMLCLCVYMCTCAHVCICVFLCMCVHTCVFMYVYMCVHAPVCACVCKIGIKT